CFSSSVTFSPRSLMVLSVVKTSWSASLRKSISSRRCLSASAFSSASLTISSISSSDNPEEDLIVMDCSLFVQDLSHEHSQYHSRRYQKKLLFVVFHVVQVEYLLIGNG